MMDRIISALLGAIVGAVGGYILADKLLSKKYQQLEDEAVASVREALGKPRPAPKEDVKPEQVAAQKAAAKPDLKNYTQYAKAYISTDTNEGSKQTIEETLALQKEINDTKDAPYIIEPEEFGMEDYDNVSLTLYSDGVLVDEDDRPLRPSEREDMIGEDNLKQMGKYESDALHIRNDKKKTDYEILADTQTWLEYQAEHPYIRDDD